MKRASILILALVALLLLAACSGGQERMDSGVEPAAKAMVDDSALMASDKMSSDEMDSEAMDDAMAAEEMASDEMASDPMAAEDGSMAEHSDQAMDDEMAAGAEEMAMSEDLPAWQTLSLINARTGEPFTLADFAGQTVFVEPMATWCTNCRRQLGNVKEAYAQLASQDVVFVALSVETTIDDTTLANYADEAGFDWLFAVLSPEMLQELAAEFGQTIANPPSTPHFVIRPDGTVFSFRTGIESTEQIVDQIQLAQG
jgi:thiol-disulfide isomerase/thioredoxin